MKSIPCIPGITDADLPPYPDSDHIPLRFHGQLRLGCKPIPGNKMQCCGCSKSAAYADMWRHLECVHGYGQFLCEGCPKTFSRDSALFRHAKRNAKTQHWSVARKAAVVNFNALPQVIELRGAPLPGKKDQSVEKANFSRDINAKFNTWRATGVFV
ncbi:hypothetical protein C8R47DRAFT_1091536 [Mycena vitilis]|nr:hypothetical protein C8R47DRAFT_1091536 [Mycena vitilis]